MGMSIDEIILKEKEIADEFQKAVDTHIVDDNGVTVEEICCDDTEIIEEHLQRYKVLADYHNTIANTMRKYQKIESVLDKIRAEVENINVWGMRYNPYTDKDIKPQIVQKVKEHVIEIIDKYKAESEG